MYKRIKIESKITNLRIVENEIERITNEIGIKQDNFGKVLVSTLEAVNNAIIHGNRSDPAKFVELEISYKNGKLNIKITDEGVGFKPSEVPDPTHPENIQSLNGRGVYLMSRLADNIKFSKKGNSVTMTFKDIAT